MTQEILILPDDVSSVDIIDLLNIHQKLMSSLSPMDSDHTLDPSGLKGDEITFWRAEIAGQLAGFAALKEIDPTSGELKSMHTAETHRGKGIAKALLDHTVSIASERGYKGIYLETGSQPGYQAARALYSQYGFVQCEPFANYTDDPNSYFMMLKL
ncbi:MAG: GNAT family N-acetyltransferase [Proteobacteria bacterium]|nr:GNAT family N-acetyltransferase [Pseudomonadota bacterium]